MAQAVRSRTFCSPRLLGLTDSTWITVGKDVIQLLKEGASSVCAIDTESQASEDVARLDQRAYLTRSVAFLLSSSHH